MTTNNKIILILAFLLTAPIAAASTLTLVVASSGYILCAILAGILFHNLKESSAVKERTVTIEQRLLRSEKSVAQLQKIRSELTDAINKAKAETVSSEQRRQETADMLAALRTQVERVARVDGLTGVANRQQFDISLHDEIKRCVRERKNVSLLLVEIDSFIDFRDINGEQRAEFTLQRVAQCMSESFRRAGDLVARIGEYQFGVLLPGTAGDTAARFAEKLRRSIYSQALPFPASEIADRITVSVGIASLPPVRLHRAEQAIQLAEAALHAAIDNGCNQISLSENAA